MSNTRNNKKINSSYLGLILFVIAVISTMVYAQTKLRITIIGDSTVCNYAASKYPQTGWGQVLDRFFTSGTITVNNKAIGGRSTRSFYQEGRWSEILPTLQNGEYVFIQFGHNDRDYTKEERYTDTTDYKEYLRKYVKESRGKGAIPVLISPMNMNAWNGANVREVFCEGANNYRGAMLNVAKELDVPFIDLEKKSVNLQKRMGQNYCARFIHLGLDPNEYPNFPDGVSDGTHFQEMGANFMAKFVCEGIAELKSNTDMMKLADLLKPQFKIGVTANKMNTGMITENGNSFPEGVSITLKVKENAGEKFLGWFDASGKSVSTAKNYTFTMKAGEISFIARFQGGKDSVRTDEVRKLLSNGIAVNYSTGTINCFKPYNKMQVALFSVDGRRVFSKVVIGGMKKRSMRIPVDNLNSGNYILKATIDRVESINSFILMK